MFNEGNAWVKDYYLSRIHQNMIVTDSGCIDTDDFSSDPNTTTPMIISPSAPAGTVTLLKKKSEPTDKRSSSKMPILHLLRSNENCDIINILADKFYKEQDARKSYELIKRILDYDFYHLQVVPLYCACLIELEKPGELYYLAHKLIASNPTIAVSWFAVVFFYFCK